MFFAPQNRDADGRARMFRGRRRRAARRGGALWRPEMEGLEGRAVPAFIAPVDYAAGASVTASAVGDFNNDGMADVVTVGNVSGRGMVQVLLNNGDGTFTPGPGAPTGNSPIEVEVGDFDDDGNEDVVTVASYYTGAVTVIDGNGDGSFRPYTPYTVLTPPTEVQVEDVNGDGHDDLIAGNHYFNSVSVFLNDGTGRLGPKRDFVAGGSPASVGVADVDGDGHADIVSTNQLSAGTVSVQRGDGTGAFGAPTNTPAFSGPFAQTLGDFNGDGKVDVAVANSYTPNMISVMLGNGDGSFQPYTLYNVGSSPLDIRQGDFNGDGKVDLIERTGAGFAVELGNGDGSFSTAVPIATPAGNGLLVGDFNADGVSDVAATSAAGNVSVMINDNSGLVGIVNTASFVLSAPSTTVAGAAVPLTVTAVDAQGNPKPDFAGTVTVVTSDPRVPGLTYTFTAADAGVHTFATGVKLLTAGPQSVMVTSPFVATASQSIVVTPGPAARFGVSTPAVTPAGDAISLTLTSLDAFGNMGADYTGTVHFTSTDPLAGLPADYTFAPEDGGIHTFSVVLKSAGARTVTAVDTASTALNGSSAFVAVTPLAAVSLDVAGGAGSIGVSRPVTVTARDIYGNVATGDSGTVHFTSTDPLTLLPPDGALVRGVGSFAVKLMAEGTQTLTVTDAADASLAGTETIVGTPADAGSFAMSSFPSTTAGVAQSFTVRVIDILGRPDTSYTGTVYFSSSDVQAGLPASYTFTPADAGVHTFSATLKTAGTQSIGAYDPMVGASGSQAGIAVKAAAAASLAANGPHSAVAGVAIPMTVTARDAYGNVATDYAGQVAFSSNDALAGLPAGYTFTAADAGVHTFAVTLKTANTKTALTAVNVVDASNTTLSASLAGIDVVNAAAASIVVTPPSNITAGTPFSLKVTVLDAFGNKVKNYAGTVHFADSLVAAGLPADYTFTGADAGVQTFTVTLNTTGTQTLSVVDVADPTLLGSATVSVKPASGGGGGGGGGTGGGTSGGGGKRV